MSPFKLTLLGMGLALQVIAPAAYAEDEANLYWGLAAGEGHVESRGNGTFDERANGGSLSLGYELSRNLSIEARYHRITGARVSTNSGYGYLRFSAPLSNNAIPYLMVGAGKTETTAKDAAGNKIDLDAANIDEPLAAAALGISLFGNETTALTLEVSAHGSDDVISSFYSIGFQHYLGGHK